MNNQSLLTWPAAAEREVRGSKVVLRYLYVSPGHNFFEHFGRAPGQHPLREMQQVECLAGRGIRGDRFLDYKNGYKGQITFFAQETCEALCAHLGRWDKAPSAFRRNVITSGLDLNALIGAEFELQGVRFRGTEECRPCAWMNEAFGPGAEEFLRGHGGLRAAILTDGILELGAA